MKIDSKVITEGVLMIIFDGAYPDGSAGQPVAQWMVNEATNLLAKYKPRALIVDLQNVTYRWGDEFDWVHDIGHSASPKIQQATIVSDLNRRAFSTLEFGTDTSDDITSLDNVFDSFEGALAWIEGQTRLPRDSPANSS